jgi:outer membrane immunogenic protein
MLRKSLGVVGIYALLLAAPLSAARAANMPVKTPPLPKRVPYTWTGFYVGANVGWTGKRVNNTYSAPGPGFPGFIAGDQVAITAGSSNSFSQSSAIFGAQAGYNYQFNKNGLIGAEIDINRLGFSNNINVTIATPFAGPVNSITSQSAGWLFTARPRLGIIFADRWLAYATGGLAVVNTGFSETNTYSAAFSNAGVDSINLGKAQTAGTAGGGLEYAMADHWSLKGEYLHVWLPNLNGVSTTPSPFFGAGVTVPYSHSVHTGVDIARFGINYHFR